MPKITIKVSINSDNSNENYIRTAILQDQILKYLENQSTTVKFNYQEDTLIRENNDFRLEYLFKEKKTTIGTFFLKENNQQIEIPVLTKKIHKENNNVKVTFEIENTIFIYEIEEIK